MKEILLTKGKIALVDDEDYILLMKYSLWQFNKGYNVNRDGVRMHRLILGIINHDILTDHKDGNGLNNQRYNLRIATDSQNNRNVKSHFDSTSKYLGVSFYKITGRWVAKIRSDGYLEHLGYFKNEKDAALAYNEAAAVIHGEFAKATGISI